MSGYLCATDLSDLKLCERHLRYGYTALDDCNIEPTVWGKKGFVYRRLGKVFGASKGCVTTQQLAFLAGRLKDFVKNSLTVEMGRPFGVPLKLTVCPNILSGVYKGTNGCKSTGSTGASSFCPEIAEKREGERSRGKEERREVMFHSGMGDRMLTVPLKSVDRVNDL